MFAFEPVQIFVAFQQPGNVFEFPMPAIRPISLGVVFRANLEQKPHTVSGNRDFEMRVLLISAGVAAQCRPGVVGRIHGASRVFSNMNV